MKGGPAFFERAEVRDVLGWLKVCAFPDDDLSLARVVNVPPRGIGDVAMERLGDWAAPKRHARDAPRCARPTRCRTFPGARPTRWRSSPIRSTSSGADSAPGRSPNPPGRCSRTWTSGPGFAGASCRRRRGRRKAEAVDAVLRSLEWHERRDPRATLATFLQRLALDSRDEEPEEVDGVTLMTLHSAKGLEFPVVFLIGVEEDLLPVSGIQGEARDLEEERRLAYVGITRARESLWVTRAAARTRRGRLEPRTPSRFLDDLAGRRPRPARPGVGESTEATSARSAEVLQALRARLGGPDMRAA